MSFYGAAGADEAAKRALKGTGLKHWRFHASNRCQVVLEGPSGYVSSARLIRLFNNWVRLGGAERPLFYRLGSQWIILYYELSEEWIKDNIPAERQKEHPWKEMLEKVCS